MSAPEWPQPEDIRRMFPTKEGFGEAVRLYTAADLEAAVRRALEEAANVAHQQAKPHVRSRMFSRLARNGYKIRDSVLGRAYIRMARRIRAIAADPATIAKLARGE